MWVEKCWVKKVVLLVTSTIQGRISPHLTGFLTASLTLEHLAISRERTITNAAVVCICKLCKLLHHPWVKRLLDDADFFFFF